MALTIFRHVRREFRGKAHSVEDVYNDGVQTPPPTFVYWPALMGEYIWAGHKGFAVTMGMFAIGSNRAGTGSLVKDAQEALWSLNGR